MRNLSIAALFILLIANLATRAGALRQQADERAARLESPSPALDEAVAARLRALGYL